MPMLKLFTGRDAFGMHVAYNGDNDLQAHGHAYQAAEAHGSAQLETSAGQ